MFIHPTYNSLHLLIQNFRSICLSSPLSCWASFHPWVCSLCLHISLLNQQWRIWSWEDKNCVYPSPCPDHSAQHNVWHRTITSIFSLSGGREGRMEGGWTDRQTDGWMNTEWTMPPGQANAIHQVRDIFVLSCQNLEGTRHCLLHLCPRSSRP